MAKHEKKCSYKGCESTGKGVRYFKFPNNPVQREKWRVASQCDAQNLDWALLCQKHFYPEDFSNISDIRSRLKYGTVPIGYRKPTLKRVITVESGCDDDDDDDDEEERVEAREEDSDEGAIMMSGQSRQIHSCIQPPEDDYEEEGEVTVNRNTRQSSQIPKMEEKNIAAIENDAENSQNSATSSHSLNLKTVSDSKENEKRIASEPIEPNVICEIIDSPSYSTTDDANQMVTEGEEEEEVQEIVYLNDESDDGNNVKNEAMESEDGNCSVDESEENNEVGDESRGSIDTFGSVKEISVDDAQHQTQHVQVSRRSTLIKGNSKAQSAGQGVATSTMKPTSSQIDKQKTPLKKISQSPKNVTSRVQFTTTGSNTTAQNPVTISKEPGTVETSVSRKMNISNNAMKVSPATNPAYISSSPATPPVITVRLSRKATPNTSGHSSSVTNPVDIPTVMSNTIHANSEKTPKKAKPAPSSSNAATKSNASMETTPPKGFIYRVVNSNNKKMLVKCSVDETSPVPDDLIKREENVIVSAENDDELVDLDANKPNQCCALCLGYPDFLPLPPALFPFPDKPRDLQLKWEALTKIPIARWHPDLRICSVHFPRESFVRKGGIMELKPDALPSITFMQADVKEEKCTIVPSLVPDELPPAKKNSSLKTRCGVCSVTVLEAEGVPLFNEQEEFTELGVALATILKATNQPLNYTHCCAQCSDRVVSCYGNIIDVNASAQITMNRNFLGKKPNPDVYHGSAALNESCPKCHTICFDFEDYTSHLMQHLCESKRRWIQSGQEKISKAGLGPAPRPKKTITIGTQVDETEIEMAFDEQAMNNLFGDATPSKRKRRRMKSKSVEIKAELNHVEEPMGDIEQLEAEGELGEPMEFIVKDEEEVDIPAENYVEAVDELAESQEGGQTTDMDVSASEAPNESVGVFVCHICGKNFSTKTKCRTHISRHNSEKTLNDLRCCHICGRNVKRKYWWVHQKYHNEGPCKICGKHVTYMAQHMALHKQQEEEKEEKGPGTEGRAGCVECRECGKEFYQRGLLRVHMFLKHGANPSTFSRRRTNFEEKWSCTRCGQEFETYRAIHQHARKFHNSKGIDMPCEECGKIYNNLQSLSTHALSAHSNYYSWKCQYCGNMFVSEEKYREHVASTCRVINGRCKKLRQREMKKLLRGATETATDMNAAAAGDVYNKYGSATFVDNLDASITENVDEQGQEVVYEELEFLESEGTPTIPNPQQNRNYIFTIVRGPADQGESHSSPVTPGSFR